MSAMTVPHLRALIAMAKEDLSFLFWEAVLRVVGGSLVLIPVLFVAVLVKVLWILR